MMTTVVLKDLSQKFDQTIAVDTLNLEVKSGEMVALLGPSGCGKTTTLRMITGLLEPTSGDVLFDGQSVKAIPTEKRGAVMVFQKHLLFPTMSVAQNVGFGLRMQKLSKTEIDRRVSEMLARVQLPGYETRQPHELSGGQQQRIALARALVVRPKVLLLDEPLANLDANLRLDMRELIRGMQQEMGITSIFVTHDQEEAVMLADRVALMFDGQLHQFDGPRSFYERPQSQRIARFFRNENILSGMKEGNLVQTAAGALAIPEKLAEQFEDGAVKLTIRPENISFAGAESNTVLAELVSSVYMGTYTQVSLKLGDEVWQAQAPVGFSGQVGDQVQVSLPAENIWLFQG